MPPKSSYLDGLVGQDDAAEPTASIRPRRSPLLGRANALERIASGEIRQVAELRIDPARCRIWKGNARRYGDLTAERCRDLIDSILAEGGQKVPALVRRVKDNPDFDFEVLVGSRRHWTIAWLRAHDYPEMVFLAQLHECDDEAAFRLADLENRARKDITDLERARNYAGALREHYGASQARMSERLKITKGWLSKMIAFAGLPDDVIGAFASSAEIHLTLGYNLASAISGATQRDRPLAEAAKISQEQKRLKQQGSPALPATEVAQRIIAATKEPVPGKAPLPQYQHEGKPALTILADNRIGIKMQIHPSSGATLRELVKAFEQALVALKYQG